MKQKQQYESVTVGSTKVAREMHGLPVFYADFELRVVVSKQNVIDGRKNRSCVPASDICETCAISLGLKSQFGSPFAPVGANRAYVALPDSSEHAVEVDGFDGKFVVWAFSVQEEARAMVVSNDTGSRPVEAGDIVALRPFTNSEKAPNKAVKNTSSRARAKAGIKTKPQKQRPRSVLEEGVRNYSGRVWV